MEKKHRRSLRLRDYEYSQAGGYFVTICTNNREFYFEKLPKLKQIAQDQWKELEKRFLEIELDEFIVMPNHIHGIIFIVGAIHELPLQNRRNMMLPKAIGYFKMNTAKQFNQILNRTGQPFWQRSYYEHVIRNEKRIKSN